MKTYSIKEFQRIFPAILKKLPILISKRGIVVAKIEAYTEYKLEKKSKTVDNSLIPDKYGF